MHGRLHRATRTIYGLFMHHTYFNMMSTVYCTGHTKAHVFAAWLWHTVTERSGQHPSLVCLPVCFLSSQSSIQVILTITLTLGLTSGDKSQGTKHCSIWLALMTSKDGSNAEHKCCCESAIVHILVWFGLVGFYFVNNVIHIYYTVTRAQKKQAESQSYSYLSIYLS